MDKVKCDFTNCYGIKKLHHEFDFSDTNAICIYARNGLMKTSFSKTFKKIQESKSVEVKDEIFDLNGNAEIKIDGTDVLPENIFVIKSFENYYESNSIASLLVDNNIKNSIATVLRLKDKFFKMLEKYSGLKVSKTSSGKKVYELEPQIVQDFNFEEDSFLLNMCSISDLEWDINFCHIKYTDIFDSTVLKKIKSDEFQDKINDFCEASNAIYEEFGFLYKGKFTLPKLKNLSKTLESDNFFVKENKIFLEGGKEIKSPAELQGIIEDVEAVIKAVPAFQEIEKMLSDTKGIILKEILENNPELLPYLKIDRLCDLRKELWLSYIFNQKALFEELQNEYRTLEQDISNINLDTTPWKKALDIFEERFTVPYKMEISNMKGAIIGESIPRVEFSFERDAQIVKLSRGALENIDVLSQGEKRALYLLNIIFDIEKNKESNREVLFIVDDIADSFDYKNKYAIVEYLYEMSTVQNFKLLILSHNFDFYRTVAMRLSLRRVDRLVARQVGDEIILIQEKYQKQPFVAWKEDMNLINTIALIPFVRNMIEYGVDKNVGNIEGIENDYLLLTHMLHEKSATNSITFDVLKSLYRTYLGKDDFKADVVLDDLVIDKMYSVADSITNNDANLEHKIVIAMAIRHKAEEFMIEKISHYAGELSWRVRRNSITGRTSDFMTHLENCGNQTRELFNAYKQFGIQENIEILEEVNIMTPENIHLNSFMYEPILDMDINELLYLYEKVKQM